MILPMTMPTSSGEFRHPNDIGDGLGVATNAETVCGAIAKTAGERPGEDKVMSN
jgi:hypothetical protein